LEDGETGRTEPERIELSFGRRLDAGDAAELAERLGRLRGVGTTMTNPIAKRVLVEFDPAKTSVEELVDLARERDPDVARALARWHVALPGLDCDRCARRAEDAVRAVPGVEAAIWNTASARLTVEYTPSEVDVADVRAALATRGRRSWCR
jgi:copper chaperone CopZ